MYATMYSISLLAVFLSRHKFLPTFRMNVPFCFLLSSNSNQFLFLGLNNNSPYLGAELK